MSLSTLKRRLRDYGLSRRGVDVSDHEVRDIVQREISGPGELRGYRAVWHSLRLNHHIHVPGERAANILCELIQLKQEREDKEGWQGRDTCVPVRVHISHCQRKLCLVVLIELPDTFQFSEHDLE